MSRRRVPRSVRIASQRWAIELHESGHVNTDGTINDGVIGQNDIFNHLIRLDELLDDQSRAETLLHEALHGVLYIAGLGTGPEAEDVVNRISPLVLDMLIQNPALVRYLTGRPE